MAWTGFNCEGEQIHVSLYGSDPPVQQAGCIPGYATVKPTESHTDTFNTKKEWTEQERKGDISLYHGFFLWESYHRKFCGCVQILGHKSMTYQAVFLYEGT